MDYFGKTTSPFGEELWAKIENDVFSYVKQNLSARRFLSLYGPLGPGVAYATIDSPEKKENANDGVVYFEGRDLKQIPQLYEDFWIYWRDLAGSGTENYSIDLSVAATAGARLAAKEDKLIFYGFEKLGIPGLLTANGIKTRKKSNWAEGENAFGNISAAVSDFYKRGKTGRHCLVLSPDIYLQLQRIQPGTGLLESRRIEKILQDKIYVSPALNEGTAALLCALPGYMDLLVGQDVTLAYMETVELNHHLRVLETVLPRVKDPEAVILFK